MAAKKKITKKMAKEIFKKVIGSSSDANIENLGDQMRDNWKMSSGLITVYCAYEVTWSPLGLIDNRDGEYIEVTISAGSDDSKIFINPETLEEDPDYTYEKKNKQWRTDVADYLQERCLAVVSEDVAVRERLDRVEI